MNFIERFLSKVEKTNSCWLWKRCILKSGYGQCWDGKKRVRAHRLSYRLFVGEIPDEVVIDHVCRIRKCVNPDHLRLLSNKENILIGTGASAVNSKKSHCIRGHKFTTDNTNLKKRPSGRVERNCKQCRKLLRRSA